MLRTMLRTVHVVLLLVSVSYGSTLRRHKRDTHQYSFNNPCGMIAQEGPSLSVSFNDSISDLIVRTEGLKLEAEQLKLTIKNRYHISDLYTEYMDSQLNFMDRNEMLVGVEQKEAAINDPEATLLSHFHLLYELIQYVQYVRTEDKIGTSEAEGKMRQELHDFESNLYSGVCSIKIALLSTGNDTTTTLTSDVLHPDFYAYGSSLENETYRVYTVMGDSMKLTGFQKEMYEAIANSINDTQA